MIEKHLQNAPIIEAVLDFRIQAPERVTIETLENLHTRVATDYPEKSGRMQLHAKVEIEPPFETTKSAGVSSQQIGFFFWSADRRQAMQARIDGFSFSRLRPYEDWNRFKTESRRLWELYAAEVDPAVVRRIGLRYINRMEFPVPLKLEDYLNTFPQIGSGCTQNISDLFMRLVVPHEFGGVTITEAIDERKTGENNVAIILDIDAFRNVEIPSHDGQKIWTVVEELRNVKNEVFFGSITSKAEALFL